MSVLDSGTKYMEELLVKKENPKDVCKQCKKLWLDSSLKRNPKFWLTYELATKQSHYEEYRLPIIRQHIRECGAATKSMELRWLIDDSADEISKSNFEIAEYYIEKALQLYGVPNKPDKDSIDNAIAISKAILQKVDEAHYQIDFEYFAKFFTLKGKLAYLQHNYQNAVIYYAQANDLWWHKCYEYDEYWKVDNLLCLLKAMSANNVDKDKRNMILDCFANNSYPNLNADYKEDFFIKINEKIDIHHRLCAKLVFYKSGNAIHDWITSKSLFY